MRKRIKPLTIALTTGVSAIVVSYCSDKIFSDNNIYTFNSNHDIAGIVLDESYDTSLIMQDESDSPDKEYYYVPAQSTTYLSSKVWTPAINELEDFPLSDDLEKNIDNNKVDFSVVRLTKEEQDRLNSVVSYNVLDNVDDYIDYSEFKNLGIANVKSYLNVRQKADIKSKAIGKMPPKAGCTILSIEDGWAKIKSGDVTGYVSTDFLLTGEDAISKVKEYGRVVIVVDCDALRVREEESTQSRILATIAHNEKLEVLSSTKDWVNVEINNYKGYVAREYVSFSYALDEAQAVEVDDEKTNDKSSDNSNSSVRASLIAKAQQYLGNPYVYGGNSLTHGIDCSGFTKQIFAMYGYSLPRTAATQANCGKAISASEVKQGDLVFYGSSGRIGHVAIYIGNGKIIHASNHRDGIKISNMYYTTPAKVVRIIN